MFKKFKIIFSVFFIFTIYPQQKLTIEDVFSTQKFKIKNLSMPKWMKNSKEYSFAKFNEETKTMDLFLHNVKTKEDKLFLSQKELKEKFPNAELELFSYQLTNDEKKILFSSQAPQKQYLSRLTPSGNYYLYDLENKNLKQLTNVKVEQYNQKFSPDNNYFGFVRNNDIYLYDLKTENEIQITHDGNENLINGKFDWVYEEEFGISDGWQFSPDSKEIFYWKLDQSEVKEFIFTEYDSTYLNHIKMKYPKAGERNSKVMLCVYNILDKKTKFINLGENEDIYIPRVYWTKLQNKLAFIRLNRDQNFYELIYADTKTGKTEVVMEEKSEGWLDIHDHITFLENGNFIFSSDRDNFLHFYLFDLKTKKANQITKGDWEVENLYGVDEDAEKIYYSSSEPSPLERQIYSISFNGKNKKQISDGIGTHSANFSPDNKYFINNFSNSNSLNQTYLKDNKGNKLEDLISNSTDIFKDYNFSYPEFFSFKTSDGENLNASIYKPKDFDKNKKYPVFIFTYGGPGSQVVRNSFGSLRNLLWYNLLLQNGYLVCMIDNRGTGSRGKNFRQIVYKNLGEWEIHDQIEGVKFLSSQSFVDSTRIGIFGWSYGGYMASMAITKAADYFKTAIAVAPVTNWKLYDNIYTERYMNTPEKNPDGYKTSSPQNYTDKIKGKFLLIHGTSDDNVHFQNSVQLATKMQNAGKNFETMFYPNKNHGIYGGKIPLHLYRIMTDFILKNL